MKQGKNKRNNTQNLKEYIQQFAQTGIKELTDIVFPPACPVCGGVLGFEKGRRRQICPDCDIPIIINAKIYLPSIVI